MQQGVSPGLADEIRRYVLEHDGSAQCPYAAYAELRRAAPVYRAPQGIWIVTDYETYNTLLRDRRISRSVAAKTEMGVAPPDATPDEKAALDSFPHMMINQDGEDHQRVRRLIRGAFLPAYVESWRPRIEEVAREVVDDALKLGAFDFVEHVGYPLPERIMTDLIGVPDGHRSIWAGWSRAITRFSRAEGDRAPDITAVRAAMTNFYVYMRDLVLKRRTEGDYSGEDMLSVLIRAEEEGDRLSDTELVATMITLTMAAHETTANLISNGIATILKDRSHFEKLEANLDLVPQAVEEMLRTDSPSPAVLPRVATDDIQVKGVTIPKGERIVFLTSAINRDPAVFDNPDTFDMMRPDIARHLAFGSGPHICIGQHLARLESITMFREVLTRMPNLRLTEEPRFSAGRARHLEKLMVAV
ncbi:MAG: cytochrome P450 [Caulobacterales bacterium]